MSSSRDLAVAVVNYRSAGLIRRLLGSWTEELRTAPRLSKIVVVDNDPGGLDDVEDLADRVRYVNLKANLGYAPGVNAACAGMSEQYILLLNPDAEVSLASIESMAAAMDADETLGAVAPLHIDHDGQPTNPFRRLPSWLDLTSHRTRIQRFEWARARVRTYLYEDLGLLSPGSPVLEIEQPPASCLLLRAAAVPGPIMDPCLPILFNDVDLSMRLRAGGWRTVVDPSVVCRHVPATSTRYLGVRGEAEFWVAAYRFVEKWEGKLRAEAFRLAGVAELLMAASEHPGRRRGNLLAARSLIENRSLFDQPTEADPVRRYWPRQLASDAAGSPR